MTIRVYSTQTASTRYVEWKPGPDLPTLGHSVIIQGGAGIANKRLLTPLGVATVVSEEDLAFLEGNKEFKEHEAAGFMKVVRSNSKKPEVDAVAGDMTQRDGSAPLVPADFPDEAEVKPKVTSDDPVTPPTTKPRTRPVNLGTGDGTFR